jgi:hypothetical protein
MKEIFIAGIPQIVPWKNGTQMPAEIGGKNAILNLT